MSIMYIEQKIILQSQVHLLELDLSLLATLPVTSSLHYNVDTMPIDYH